jgi:hypothetical protein
VNPRSAITVEDLSDGRGSGEIICETRRADIVQRPMHRGSLQVAIDDHDTAPICDQ